MSKFFVEDARLPALAVTDLLHPGGVGWGYERAESLEQLVESIGFVLRDLTHRTAAEAGDPLVENFRNRLRAEVHTEHERRFFFAHAVIMRHLAPGEQRRSVFAPDILARH